MGFSATQHVRITGGRCNYISQFGDSCGEVDEQELISGEGDTPELAKRDLDRILNSKCGKMYQEVMFGRAHVSRDVQCERLGDVVIGKAKLGFFDKIVALFKSLFA